MLLELFNHIVFYLIEWRAVTWSFNYNPDIIHVTAVIKNLDSAAFDHKVLTSVSVDCLIKPN
ncbi:hypothetical protein AO265_41195 [Pseudomonas sp. ABAC61]|nr:hypothetical protein AO265_41195 [Pseudomonas sp. ABAC61]